MNFDLTDDQTMMRESFARFLSAESSMARVRAAAPLGFDPALWKGLADLGALSLRAPASAGGLELGLLDAAVLMEEAGRTLASAPLAESIAAIRALALLGADAELCAAAMAGDCIVTLAFHDIAEQPEQWVAGGAVAQHVLARNGDDIVLVRVADADRTIVKTMASTPMARLRLGALPQQRLGKSAPDDALAKAMEEWKLYTAAALAGLAREAVRLAAAYASERAAFGQKIGAYQAISHPLADLITEIDGGTYLVWKAIHDIAHARPKAGALISLAAWWNAKTAGHAVGRALHTFGGYGLTTEYDIHLYNIRAKSLLQTFADPARLLDEAAGRLYRNRTAALPDAGDVAIEFELGEEADALAGEVDAFFKANLTPELKAKAHFSWDGHDPGLHKKIADAGLLFPAWPKALGGRDASPYAAYATRKVWSKHGWSGHAVGTTSMVAMIIHRFGSDELKRDVLSKIVSGDIVCSLGYSEPGAGSDVFAAQCRARPEGNGWRIDGTKMFTSGANLADYVLMLTRTNTDVAKHKGLTMFIAPLKTDGVTVQPVYTFGEERTNITFYDNVRIPDSYRLGEVDKGVVTMSAGLELEHSGGFDNVQHELLEAAEALCASIKHAGGSLLDDPQAQARLARTYTHAAIAELLALRSLWAATEKRGNPAFGPMAKMFSSERLREDAEDLLDLTAPHSLTDESGPSAVINLTYRHAQATTIYGGTSEVHRSLIAERYLDLPRTR
jgi:alkylation response protein AidB-like acyl-CoA dehydrogenase